MKALLTLAFVWILAGTAGAQDTRFRIEPPPGLVRAGSIAEVRTVPALGVTRDELLVIIAGQDAEVDSIAGDRLRVRVPRLPSGAAQVRVTAISRTADQPHRTAATRITIAGAEASHQWTAGLIALAIVAAVLFVMYRSTPKTNANTWNRFMFLMYDNGTDSYSVKRLQAVLWFGTVLPIVLFAFIYTQLASGVGTWITLPANILFLLGTSAATTVLAERVEKLRQVPVKSSAKRAVWQDLFQEGESFSFPRFQIVCWTVVTCAFFLVTYWNGAEVDPATLPTIPSDFWLLMGLSSATYVGAKVAMPANGAPEILSAVVTPTRSEWIVRVRNAALRFDLTPEGWFTIEGTGTDGQPLQFALDATQMTTQQIDARVHRMTLPLGPNGEMRDQAGGTRTVDYLKPLKVHLVNPDGQLSADVPVTC